MLTIELPETQYVLSGELSIAYQVFGHGDTDLLYVPGIISHVELMWADADSRAFLTTLGQHFRVIIFDKRGQGMSDRIEGATTLENALMTYARSWKQLIPKAPPCSDCRKVGLFVCFLQRHIRRK